MKTFLVLALLFITSSLLYGLAMKGVYGNPTAGSLVGVDEYSLRDRGRYLLTQNLVERQSFALTREQADIAAPDVGYSNGNWYELYPPGLSILAIPFYLIGLQFNMSLLFTFAMGGLFAVGGVLLVFLIGKQILKLPYWASIMASLVFGFGSTSFGYASSLFQHHATAFFILSGFYAVYQYKAHQRWGFFWGFYIWLAYSVAITIDYPNAILMFPVMVYFLFVSVKVRIDEENYKISFRPAIIFTAIFFVIISLLHGYYNYSSFGGWAKLSGSLPGYREGLKELYDQGNIEEINKQVKAAQLKKKPAKFFREHSLLTGGNIILFASDRGLFVYSPIFVLGILGMLYAIKKIDLEKSILIALVLLHIFLYASWGDPWSGWAFGSRYLIPVMSYLSLFVAVLLSRNKYKWLTRTIAYILFITSSAIATLGALTTNAVPPRVEAIPLKVDYGLAYNINFLISGKTQNFVFNYYLREYIDITLYYIIIVVSIATIGFFVIFILPLFSKREKLVVHD